MQHRTLEEYKEEVFDKLDEQTKLECLYEMSEKLCNIEEYIHDYTLSDDTGFDSIASKELMKIIRGEDNE